MDDKTINAKQGESERKSSLVARATEDKRKQFLKEHLSAVLKYAGIFGDKCGVGEITRLAGRLHDLGKSAPEWQEYLEKKVNGENPKQVNHSARGAKYIYDNVGDNSVSFKYAAELLANVIASHHGRLRDNVAPNGVLSLNDELSTVKALSETSVRELVNGDIDADALKNEFEGVVKIAEKFKADKAFFVSMLVKLAFSCLVDADRLDAYLFEIEYKDEEKYLRNCADWNALISALENRLSGFNPSNSEMAKLRRKVSDDCKIAGKRDVGIYKLEVPTGGGKTLSSLRFALEHAKEHNMDRIIYVIPYLSILSQTAKEIRETLNADDDVILEHHSGFLTDNEDEDNEKYYKLQTDRWDSPIILTTQVQFLESVFSAKGSDLRKLHNMANSAIIFDEAQSVPIKCVHLFNSAINFINKVCKSTILLCTATQPPFESVRRKILFSENPSLTGYIEPPKRYEIKSALTKSDYSYPELADFVADKHNNSTLVIVNTKSAAKNLCAELITKGLTPLHLSTNMCSAHRDYVIAEIRDRLNKKESIICVSTQLIEAGVDISFERVIRDVAGLDSIFQAAGRCNRHGEYDEVKDVYVVNIKDENLSRLEDIKTGARITRRLFDENNVEINAYYRQYFYDKSDEMDYRIKDGTIYDRLSRNREGVGVYRNRNGKQNPPVTCPFAIRSAADEFYVIEKGRTDIIVPYENSGKLLEDYRRSADVKEKRSILKKLGKYGVSVYKYQLDELEKRGALDRLNYDGLIVLADGFYDGCFGLNLDGKHELLNV